MKHRKRDTRQRLQLVLMAVSMLALGALLLFLSVKVQPETQPRARIAATTTAPATSPAGPPVDERKTAAARNMSGMLLLFGLVACAVSVVCVVWLIVDIRRSRPAWMTQQRYPRRR